jgi:hypothetical protein
VRTTCFDFAETSTSRVSQRWVRMVVSAKILTMAMTNDRPMNSGIIVTKCRGWRSRWGSILAERLTSHHSARSPATSQCRFQSASPMYAGEIRRVKELTALSIIEKARNL